GEGRGSGEAEGQGGESGGQAGGRGGGTGHAPAEGLPERARLGEALEPTHHENGAAGPGRDELTEQVRVLGEERACLEVELRQARDALAAGAATAEELARVREENARLPSELQALRVQADAAETRPRQQVEAWEQQLAEARTDAKWLAAPLAQPPTAP